LDLPWYDSWYGIGWDGDATSVVYENNAGYVENGASFTGATTQENVPISLTYHNPNWPNSAAAE
jgi:hypothetical protein